VPTLRAHAETTGTTAAVTTTMPTGWAAGDALLLFVGIDSITVTMSAGPSGWGTPLEGPFTNTDSERCWLYGKTAQAGDTAPGMTLSGAVGWQATIAAVQDADTVDPWDGSSSIGAAAGATYAIPSFSTTNPGTLLCEFAYQSTSAAGAWTTSPGTSGTAVGSGEITWGTTAGATPGTPTATNPSNALFGAGNTVATADFQTTAQGLLIAATPSAAGVSVTPNVVVFQSLD
jgi:hypothetical protein